MTTISEQDTTQEALGDTPEKLNVLSPLYEAKTRLEGEGDRHLDTLIDRLEKRHIGSAEKAYLDSVSAVLFDDGPIPKDADEMGVRLQVITDAFSGEPRAMGYVRRLLEARAEKEQQTADVSEEALALATDHVLVRTTNNPPEIDAEGVVVMKTAAEHSHGSDRPVPRPTLHFSVDHLVQSHLLGDTEKRAYTVIAPLDKALQANGKPAAISGVDTFFTAGPGEAVALPEALIVMSGGDQKELTIQEGTTLRVKTAGFAEIPVSEVIEQLSGKYTYSDVQQAAFDSGLLERGKTYDSFAIENALAAVPDADRETLLAELNRKLAINQAIKRVAGSVAVSDGQSVYSSVDKQLEKLSDSLDVPFQLHYSTQYSWMEDKALGTASIDPETGTLPLLAELDAKAQRLYVLAGYAQAGHPRVIDSDADSGV